MAIANVVEIILQPFQHRPQGGQPTGLFGASLDTTGDVSGGNKVTTIQKTSGNPAELIYQFDQIVVANDDSAGDIFHLTVGNTGLYGADLIIGGIVASDKNESLREMNGYILYPQKGETRLMFLTIDNDDGQVTSISVRGRYWEKSYLRERGETPAFR